MGQLLVLSAFVCTTCQAVSRVITDLVGVAQAARLGCDHEGTATQIIL